MPPSTRESASCTLPPSGWRCSREPGHSGPCAGWPDEDAVQLPQGWGFAQSVVRPVRLRDELAGVVLWLLLIGVFWFVGGK